MSFEEAVRLLDRLAPGDHLWKKHSYCVAEVAHILAQALLEEGEKLDPHFIRIAALLHDAGRAKTHGPLHGWVGYVLLRKEGVEHYARGCIVHWLKGRTEAEVLADGKLSPRFVRRLYLHFKLPHLTLTDKILALADSLVMHDRVVPLEKRYADLQLRYGKSDWLQRHEQMSREYQEEIESLLGCKLETLLARLQ